VPTRERRRTATMRRICALAALLATAPLADAALTDAQAAGRCPALSARVAANTAKRLEVLTITAQPCVIKLMLYDAGDAQAEDPLRASLARRPQYGTAEIAGREIVYTVGTDFRGRAAFTLGVEGIAEPVTVVIQASEWSATDKE
jgi:hypothetical protein